MAKMKMTSARKEKFLEELAIHGLVTKAAKAASPHSANGCHTSFKEERGRDPEFAAAWDKALEIADEVTIAEIRRRGIEGYESPVWGSLGNNEGTGKVGTEIKYSDKMAELFARIQSLRVRQALTNKVEMSGSVEHKTKLDLSHLSDEQLASLREMLEPQDDPAE